MLYLTLRQYEYIVAIARAGSLTGAAQTLNVSQPSLSVALHQVEAHLGQTLFLRRKGVQTALTDFGRDYVQRAEALIGMAASMEDAKAALANIDTVLRVGCLDDLAPRFLPGILAKLKEVFPNVTLRWRTGDFSTIRRDVVEGRVDFALSYELGFDSTFAREHVGKIRPYGYVSSNNRLASCPSVTLASLADQPLILFEDGLSISHIVRLFRQIGRVPNIAHRVNTLELMRSLAANDDGVGISYTHSPTTLTHDCQSTLSLPISDNIALEPLVLCHAIDQAPSRHTLLAVTELQKMYISGKTQIGLE